MADATGVPYSCGDFDSAIEHLEAGRAANDELRGVAITALEQLAVLEDEIHDFKKQISDLQNLIEELELTLENERCSIIEPLGGTDGML